MPTELNQIVKFNPNNSHLNELFSLVLRLIVMVTLTKNRCAIMNIDQNTFEALQQEFRNGFAAIHQDMDNRLGFLDERFSSIDKRFDFIDKRINTLDIKLDNTTKKLSSRLDKLQSEVTFLHRSLYKVEDRLGSLETKVDSLEIKIDIHRQQTLSNYTSTGAVFTILMKN